MAKCPKCNRNLPAAVKQCAHCGAGVTWWLSRDGEVYGPYDEQTVRYIVRDRRATLDDPAMIGREGTWRPLGELLGPDAPQTAARRPRSTSQEPAPYRHWSAGGWLVYIAILFAACAVIAGVIAWPTYRQLDAGDGDARSRAHLEQVYLALKLYAHENGGQLPPQGEWTEVVESFIGPERVQTPAGKAYRLNDTLGGQSLADLATADDVPVLASEPSGDDPLSVRADGTIEPGAEETLDARASGGG
jgi:hypothetical protein